MTSPAQTSGRRGLLAQSLQELLTVGVRLRANPTAAPNDVAAFRQNVLVQVANAGTAGKAAGYRDDDVNYATYAAVAFLDESVLAMSAPALASWQGRPLQEELFGVHIGGDVFFDYLNTLLTQQDSEDLADTLEVYQLCLLLGFRGRYGSRPDELHSWTSRLRARIAQIRGELPAMAPQWAPSHDEVVAIVGDPWQKRLRLAIAGAFGMTAVIFLVYWLILGGRVGDVVASTHAHLPTSWYA
jgi:type VI secretion system protein ImpK